MKNKIYSFSVVCLLFLSVFASFSYGQQTSSDKLRYELFEHNLFYSTVSTDSMRYRLLFPKNYNPEEYFKRYPLVLFLHGAGERGDSSLTVKHIGAWALQEKNRENYDCFVLVPQCEKDNKWVEVDWSADAHTQPKEMSKYMSLTVELLEKLQRRLPIDSERIYLTGLSMGGYGTWDLAARYPKKFAAIVPICGGADEKTASSLATMPTWVFHGALDQTVKPQRSRNMVAALKKTGNKNVHYTEYEKVRHGSWKPAYKDEEMWKWLFEQSL
ncbi:prolyl oligopeptidase family serine peptidase [Bernardetia sp.]|uniref:carboxylesterase family protein n=1 Tax=Bernardetia sp. TaxID=1937974 RepID=UPI0025C56707|nr:prolyl oligopeptidase family serine peptidase [Bernardetia sp.]